MKKIFLIAYLLIQASVLSFSLDLESNHWYDFKGKLGSKSIQLSFYTLPSGRLIGSYCSFSNEAKVALSGTVKGNEIFLIASINGKITSELSGKIFTDDQDRLEGTWRINATNEKMMFKSSLISVTAGTFEKRYTDLVGSDAALEGFVVMLKSALVKNDKSWLGDRIFYPLKVRVSEKSSIIVKNKSQFLLMYDKIFTPALKEKISMTFSYNLFNNYQGVMIGDGQLWINNALNGTEAKPQFQIIAINP
jgi:hypothetical protein